MERDHSNFKTLKEWLAEDPIPTQGEELESIRAIRFVPAENPWIQLPNEGEYQPTRLTAEGTMGKCNAYFVRLQPGECFPMYPPAGAYYIVTGIRGTGSHFWWPNDTPYKTLIADRTGLFVIPHNFDHAIGADQGKEVIFLVIEIPALNVSS